MVSVSLKASCVRFVWSKDWNFTIKNYTYYIELSSEPLKELRSES